MRDKMAQQVKKKKVLAVGSSGPRVNTPDPMLNVTIQKPSSVTPAFRLREGSWRQSRLEVLRPASQENSTSLHQRPQGRLWEERADSKSSPLAGACVLAFEKIIKIFI